MTVEAFASKYTRMEVINWLQLITLVGGLIVGAMAVGRRDADIAHQQSEITEIRETIKSLASITSDMARTDVRHDEQIANLKERLGRLP